MNNRGAFGIVVSISFLVILAFGIIRWMHLDAGTLGDWISGLAAFWWLSVVVTVPWDMYFKAREIITDAQQARQSGLTFRDEDEGYARRVAQIYLLLAIGLHLLSAAVLYALAYFGVSAIGYWASIIALLLTLVRPLYRLNQYIIMRLSSIQEQNRFPRNDVNLLKAQLEEIQSRLIILEGNLDIENEYSFAGSQLRNDEGIKKELQETRVALQNLQVNNAAEHQQLIRRSEEALAKLSEDAIFLNQARELIRFIKNA